MQSLIDSRIREQSDRQILYRRALDGAGLPGRIDRFWNQLSFYQKQLQGIAANKTSFEELKLQKSADKLESLNPVAILKRGFTLTEQDGKVIKAAAELDKEQPFTLTFSDGKLTAKAIDKS